MMTNSDLEGQIFRSHPHRINGFFFLLTGSQKFLNMLYLLMFYPFIIHINAKLNSRLIWTHT